MLDALQTWLDRRRAMRDLRRLQREDDLRGRYEIEAVLQSAKDALAREDRKVAMNAWLDMKQRFSFKIRAKPDVLQLLLDLRLYEDAEEMMRIGRKKSPNDPFFYLGLAQIAHHRHDIPTASKRWAVLRRKFPMMSQGYSEGAACLARQSLFDEADNVLERGIRHCPDDMGCRLQYAKLAEARGDLDTALKRWESVQHMSDQIATWSYRLGLLGKAQCLRKMGQLAEAEKLMMQAREVLHGNITPLVELAEIAQDRGDWPEAVRRWQVVMTRFALLPAGFMGCAAALEHLGKTEEAEEVLRKSIDLHHDQAIASMRYAMMAEERGDFEEAVRRWAAAREKFPNHPDPYLHGAGSLDRLGRKTEASALREEHKRRSAH